MPVDILFVPFFPQNGHFCFFLCLLSISESLDLALFPYLAPNLPAALAFFVFEVIFKMGLPGFEPGSSGPKPEILPGYTTTP